MRDTVLEQYLAKMGFLRDDYYKVYYKGTFCRGLLMILLLGIFAYSGFYLCIVFYFWRYYWC